MSSSRQFAIMSLHGGQKYYHEVCTNYLSHSAISSIVSGKGSMCATGFGNEVFEFLVFFFFWGGGAGGGAAGYVLG